MLPLRSKSIDMIRILSGLFVVVSLTGFTFFDISNKLINNDNCVFGHNATPVIIKNGNVIPKKFPSVVIAEIVKLDARSVRFWSTRNEDARPIVLSVKKQGGSIVGEMIYQGASRNLIVCQ